jgi:hypothetical protein
MIKMGDDFFPFKLNIIDINGKIEKTKRANKTIVDTIGTLLLLVIAVALLSVKYLSSVGEGFFKILVNEHIMVNNTHMSNYTWYYHVSIQ